MNPQDSPLPDPDPPPVEPRMPEDSACCGSGCDPCVYDLYAEEREKYFAEMRAWRARRAATPAAAPPEGEAR